MEENIKPRGEKWKNTEPRMKIQKHPITSETQNIGLKHTNYEEYTQKDWQQHAKPRKILRALHLKKTMTKHWKRQGTHLMLERATQAPTVLTCRGDVGGDSGGRWSLRATCPLVGTTPMSLSSSTMCHNHHHRRQGWCEWNFAFIEQCLFQEHSALSCASDAVMLKENRDLT